MSDQQPIFAMVVDRAHIEPAKEAARQLELTLPKGAAGWRRAENVRGAGLARRPVHAG